MQVSESKYWQEGIDSKALLVCFLQKMPYLLLMGVAGAVLGSGLYLLIALVTSEGPKYRAETEYYIDFAAGRFEMRDYYNDATWNDVLATDLILGNTMELLGSTYEKETVKGMITANIFSDVRYLTIVVEGDTEREVAAVSDATKSSLERFGVSKDEFDSIYQIENNGVELVEEIWFTWGACMLGAFVGMLVGSFSIVASFCLGSSFYTRKSVMEGLGIPVFGLLYTQKKVVQDEALDALQMGLQNQLEKINAKQVGFVDCIEYDCAKRCKQILETVYTMEEIGASIEVWHFPIRTKAEFDAMRMSDGVILMIPFAKSCRERIEECMHQLAIQECKVLGAVLVDVKKSWMKMYMK